MAILGELKQTLHARILATSAAALFIQVGVQFLVGIFLSRAYKPLPEVANDTVRLLMDHQPHAFFVGLHYWGPMVLLIHGAIHLLMLFLWEAYRPPQHWRWWGGLLILLSLFLWQVTGNLLPFDKHGVQTAVIEGGIAARVPLVGGDVSRLMLQGDSFGPATLLAWYAAHKWLITLIFLLGLVATLASTAPRREGRANRIVMFLPLLLPIALSLLIARPLGTEATVADFNRYDASAGWYTMFMHGTLQAFDRLGGLGWIGSAVLPGLFLGFLFALPWLSKRFTHTMLQLYAGVFVLVFLVCGLIFGRGVAPLTGTRDPVVAAVPEPPRTSEQRLVDQVLFAEGRKLFNAEGCANCHGTDGKKASGGPDLTNVHKEHSDPEWYVRFIRDPKSVKPASTMPAFPLEDAKLRALAEFLSYPR